MGDANKVNIETGSFIPTNANNTNNTAGFPDGRWSPPHHGSHGTPAPPADFDVGPDRQIGYLDVENSTVWNQLFPAVTGETPSTLAGEDTGHL